MNILISLLIFAAIVVVVVLLVKWVLGQFKVPEPIQQITWVVLGVLFILGLLNVLGVWGRPVLVLG